MDIPWVCIFHMFGRVLFDTLPSFIIASGNKCLYPGHLSVVHALKPKSMCPALQICDQGYSIYMFVNSATLDDSTLFTLVLEPLLPLPLLLLLCNRRGFLVITQDGLVFVRTATARVVTRTAAAVGNPEAAVEST